MTLASAISLYLPTLPHLTPLSFNQVRLTLARFERKCGKTTLEAIRAEDYRQFAEGLTLQRSRVALSHLRGMMEWARREHNVYAYRPPSPAQPSERLLAPDILEAAQRLANLEIAREAAARMALPHQRAIFLCGFLYGWSLDQTRRVTLREIIAQPQRKDIADALAACTATAYAPSEPFFARWLGRSRQNAQRRWRQWSGGIWWVEVQRAGDVARRAIGIRPILERPSVKTLAMPAMTPEAAEQMPRMWGI